MSAIVKKLTKARTSKHDKYYVLLDRSREKQSLQSPNCSCRLGDPLSINQINQIKIKPHPHSPDVANHLISLGC